MRLGRTKLCEAFHRAVWHDSLIASALVFAVLSAVWTFAPVNHDLKLALVFGAMMAPASALIRISSSAANSRRRFQLSYVPDFLFRPGLLLVFLLVMWALHVSPDLVTMIGVVVAHHLHGRHRQAVLLGRSVLPRLARSGPSRSCAACCAAGPPPWC